MVGGRDGEASARALAERWQVEYLDAGAITVDPRALSLLAPADAKRLRAVPLAVRGSTGLVAVAAPGEERFAAIRERTGPGTQFAVVSEQTLDALLASRLFAERLPAPPPEPAHAPPPAPPPRVEAPPPAPASAPPDDEVVNAVVAAVLERLAPQPTRAEATGVDTAELDRTREALRAAKEELAAANAELDQSRLRIRALETRLQEVARLLIPSEEHVGI
jgi:Type II secretion system (T2SS), protein E, N-terminal domain